MSLAFAAVLTRLDRGRANPVFRAASLLFGVISAGVIAMGLGLILITLIIAVNALAWGARRIGEIRAG